MRMLEKVMNLVWRGIKEKSKEQHRDGEIGRMLDASMGVRRHCVNGTRAFSCCQTLEVERGRPGRPHRYLKAVAGREQAASDRHVEIRRKIGAVADADLEIADRLFAFRAA